MVHYHTESGSEDDIEVRMCLTDSLLADMFGLGMDQLEIFVY